jgi:PAS domain S-box-containing protein
VSRVRGVAPANLLNAALSVTRSVAQLNMLHKLAARLNQLNDVRQIGEAVTTELHALVDYHNCRVFVLDADGETLLPIAFRGDLVEYQGETYDLLVTRVGAGITGHVARTGVSHYAPDAAADPHAEVIQGTADVDESILAVPLLVGGRVIGVVVLSKLGIDRFDTDDVRLLELLASHAAVAIENARLLARERETAARALESEARQSAIIESALDCVVVIDSEGRVVEFNPAAEATFGYAKAEALGRELAELIVPPHLRDGHRNGLARYLDTGRASMVGHRIEIEAMRADGSVFPVELAVGRVDLPGPPMFTGSIRDITERRRAEEEVQRAVEAEREAARRLRALDDMKNAFLQAVSHDLRTPLAAILGIALTLDRQDLELAVDDQRDLLRRLAANARKLDRILSNLLDLERLARGHVQADRTRVGLDGLVRRVVEELDLPAGRVIHLGTSRVWADVDPAKVERIVENLVMNAVKHTAADAEIWVEVSEATGGSLISVDDSGPGVPAELREAVFEPFRQVATGQPAPGSGIGLSVVGRLAALHGGRAWVEDRPGGGAAFRVLLPNA